MYLLHIGSSFPKKVYFSCHIILKIMQNQLVLNRWLIILMSHCLSLCLDNSSNFGFVKVLVPVLIENKGSIICIVARLSNGTVYLILKQLVYKVSGLPTMPHRFVSSVCPEVIKLFSSPEPKVHR